MWHWIVKWGAPKVFYQKSGKWLPWLWVLSLGFIAYGVVGGLLLAPPDYQQGDGFRIIYVHVPCALLSMFIYMFMAMSAAIYFIWRIKIAGLIVRASVRIGMWFTMLALITGAIWGKPMWGTWWIWDARLTSELILLFLYFGVMALFNAIPDKERALRAASLIILVGAIDIPIIHYSVNWWNTLHQGATITQFAKPNIANTMLYPLLAMIIGFFSYFFALVLMKVRSELLHQEQNSQWVSELL